MIKEPHNKNYQDKCCENCQHKASNTGSSENIKEIKASTCLAFEEIEAEICRNSNFSSWRPRKL